MKSFYFWASLLPIISLVALWKLEYSPSSYIGYVLPAIGLAITVALLIASVVSGLLTKTFKKSVLGFLISIPISFFVVIAVFKNINQKNSFVYASKTKQLDELIKKLKSQPDGALATNLSKEQIQQAFNELKNISSALAVCQIVRAENPAPESLLKITDAVLELSTPLPEKESVLYHVLNRLAQDPDSDKVFPAWLSLWDKTHLPDQKGLKWIEIKQTREKEDAYCEQPTTESLAQVVFNTWKDVGIETWLASGHKLTSTQQHVALQNVSSVRTLDHLIKDGTDIHAKNPQAASGGIYENPILIERSYTWYFAINDSVNPRQVADLVQAFIKYGSNVKDKSVDGKTSCQLFLETESSINDNAFNNKSSLNEKKQAFALIRTLLCQ